MLQGNTKYITYWHKEQLNKLENIIMYKESLKFVSSILIIIVFCLFDNIVLGSSGDSDDFVDGAAPSSHIHQFSIYDNNFINSKSLLATLTVSFEGNGLQIDDIVLCDDFMDRDFTVLQTISLEAYKEEFKSTYKVQETVIKAKASIASEYNYFSQEMSNLVNYKQLQIRALKELVNDGDEADLKSVDEKGLTLLQRIFLYFIAENRCIKEFKTSKKSKKILTPQKIIHLHKALFAKRDSSAASSS